MIGFLISLNDGRSVTCGAEDLATLTIEVSAVGNLSLCGSARDGSSIEAASARRVTLSIIGKTKRGDNVADEYYSWADDDPLRVGDEIVVEIVNVGTATTPICRRPAKIRLGGR